MHGRVEWAMGAVLVACFWLGCGDAGSTSDGCGSSERPAGGMVSVDGEYIYRFPAAYDGVTPMPLVFAFHANANPNTQLLEATQGTPLESDFVMAFPKSVGAGWVYDVDAPRFDRLYRDLVSRYCIDTNRVFALGHSSGALFIESLLCHGERRFRAVAPSASARMCERWSPTPVLLIHGRNDTVHLSFSQDADGRKDLDGFLTSNACGAATRPYEVAGCSRDGKPVDPGCVSYDGCSARTVWCNHDDPNYDGTNHGWACFASLAIADFFGSFR